MAYSYVLKNTLSPKKLLNLGQLFGSEEGACLFFSGGEYATAKHSFLALMPFDFISLYPDKQVRYQLNGPRHFSERVKNPWDILKTMLSDFNSHYPFPRWTGFLSYEMGAFSDQQKSLELLFDSLPLAFFQRNAITLVMDHHQEQGTLWIDEEAEYFFNERQYGWYSRLCQPSYWEELLKIHCNHSPEFAHSSTSFLMEQRETSDSYEEKIGRAKSLIRDGEIYQINLSQKFEVSGSIDAYQLFYQLNQLNPSPFSAYLRLSDFAIVSLSPERFLKKYNSIIESHPIKGTAPRGCSKEEDIQNLSRLLASEKERAELLMITDLVRNDLGKISLPGTVHTPEVCAYEAYSNVFHLYSIIRSTLLPEFHPVDAVRSCFPGGSITGCPKLSAMEVIKELEQRPRGIYTGAIGYFSGNGDFDFNIAIRTVVINKTQLSIQLGGAIVADSDPKKEYEETLHKGSTIFKALNLKY